VDVSEEGEINAFLRKVSVVMRRHAQESWYGPFSREIVAIMDRFQLLCEGRWPRAPVSSSQPAASSSALRVEPSLGAGSPAARSPAGPSPAAASPAAPLPSSLPPSQVPPVRLTSPSSSIAGSATGRPVCQAAVAVAASLAPVSI
jgi:hypothetical protein